VGVAFEIYAHSKKRGLRELRGSALSVELFQHLVHERLKEYKRILPGEVRDY